jgi:membrane associated rhomboid family serine protease
MSTGGPDLFVICKNCRSEVSPYITECPYCGNRLRKRAPKIDREGRVAERRRRRRPPAPALPRLRRGEIPGIRGDLRPQATAVLVVLGVIGCLLWRTALVSRLDLAIMGKPGQDWWRLFTAPFTYTNTGYAFVALSAIALYGWLLERRHGALAVIALFALGGVGGTLAATALYPFPVVLGANGAALAMIVAWALPDVLDLRAGREIDGDLLGTAVFAAVVALLPLTTLNSNDPFAYLGATWPADAVGLLAGLAIGVPLYRTGER